MDLGNERTGAVTLDALVILRRGNAAWRLLAADHAPAVITFLDAAFLSSGVRTASEPMLADVLRDVLDEVNDTGLDVMAKTPHEYLIDWCSDSCGWLRRNFSPGSDEPVYDLTPRAEAAVVWVKGLMTSRGFIGTQSRLLQVVDLLDQIVEGSQADPEERLRRLEQRRADLDAQIEAVRAGRIDTLSASEVRDRYQTLSSLARGLLADFREVEENFRALDRETRERVARWDGPRGPLLDEVLGRRHFITEAETGASFVGFYDFLFDPGRWERFQSLLRSVAAMNEVAGVDDGLPMIARDWLVAAEQVQLTVARLSAQMRRFLEEQRYADNRRIASLVQAIESKAVDLRDNQPVGADVMAIDEPRADLVLPVDKKLWEPPVKQDFPDPKPADPPTAEEIGEELFAGQRVDPTVVRAVLASTLALFPGGLSVKDVVDLEPLTEGLAELVTLLEVATEARWLTDVDVGVEDEILLVEQGGSRLARMPRMLLTDVGGDPSHDDY
ncbi:MAG: DUF3375 domain-containing protein [Sporichthyaceae bacterium]